jgi:hypothetical protein
MIGLDDDDSIVRIVRVDAPPLAVSEATCERVAAVPAEEWLETLRKWRVAYRRSGKLHVALLADIELAIRAGATTSKPGPKQPKRRSPETDDPRALLEAAGFRRAK